MKRIELAPAQQVSPILLDAHPGIWPDRAGIPFPTAPEHIDDEEDDSDSAVASTPPTDSLGAASPALEQRRHLFRPRRGWFRRLERRVSHFLSGNVYPWIPGISLAYDRTLRRELRLSDATIALDGLPRAFDGLRILLVSDIHAGAFVSRRSLRGAIDRLMTTRPDVIFIGGDLVTAKAEEFEQHRKAFTALQAPLGVYAVLGNHDYYGRDASRLVEMVRRTGIVVLLNESTELHRDGERLSLAGVDDLLMGRPDLERALAGTRSPVVLLSHNPDLLFEAERHGVSLMLSGHTHAGQVRVPGMPVLVRQSRYRLDQGRYRSGNTELVVSAGLGAVGVPFRWGCPPEAVLLTLQKKPSLTCAASDIIS